MKKTVVIISFFSFFYLSAQQGCGTLAPVNYIKYSTTASKSLTATNVFCVDIFFHIVRKTDGSGGFDPADLEDIIINLNKEFNQHFIFFNNKGFDYIDDTNYYDIDAENYTFDQLGNINDKSNAIDFYLVEVLRLKINGVISTYGGVADGTPSKTVCVDNSAALDTTSAHEIGHAFNLLHTHETDNGVELISGNNCQIAGDLICDTPADPNLLNKVDFSCNYIGGGGYSPLVNNIMSYAPRYCTDSFTEGQENRMKTALWNSSVLQQVISTTCSIPYIIGPSTICGPKTYTLVDAPANSNVSWSVSANLNKLFETDAYVSVEPDNYYLSDNATITVNVNGYITEKDISIGPPNVSSTQINHSPPPHIVNWFTSFHVDESENNAEYHWTITLVGSDCCSTGTAEFYPDHGTTYVSSGPNVSVFWGDCEATYEIKCEVKNECGSAGTGSVVVSSTLQQGQNPCGPLMIIAAPNPWRLSQGNGLGVNLEQYPCDNGCGGNGIEGGGGDYPPPIWVGTVKIFDLQGNSRHSQNFDSSEFVINGIYLEPGQYILDVTTDNGYFGQELIIVE